MTYVFSLRVQDRAERILDEAIQATEIRVEAERIARLKAAESARRVADADWGARIQMRA